MMRIRYNESYLIKGNEMENLTTAMLMYDDAPYQVLNHDEMIRTLLLGSALVAITLIVMLVIARFEKK